MGDPGPVPREGCFAAIGPCPPAQAYTLVLRSRAGQREFRLSAALFRVDGSSHLLARVAPLDAGAAVAVESQLHRIVEHLPDGLVVTEPDGRVLTALRDNPEFGFEQMIDLCGVDYSAYGDAVNRVPVT